MALNSLWEEETAPSLATRTRAKWELRNWLGAELKKGAPGSAHQRLAEDLLCALWNDREDDWNWVRRAILKQEVWRILVTLRGAGMNDSEAIAEVERIVPRLARRMEQFGVGQETVGQVHERLQEALKDVRDWPLV
ncbi:MAG: hypothetical protein ABIF09_02640 [Gemmatimonadota bacterium]